MGDANNRDTYFSTRGAREIMIKESPVICSSCEEGVRYLLKLKPSTPDANHEMIFLICEACLGIWTDSYKLGYNDFISKEKLAKDLKFSDYKALFKKSTSVREADINDSSAPWKALVNKHPYKNRLIKYLRRISVMLGRLLEKQ